MDTHIHIYATVYGHICVCIIYIFTYIYMYMHYINVCMCICRSVCVCLFRHSTYVHTGIPTVRQRKLYGPYGLARRLLLLLLGFALLSGLLWSSKRLLLQRLAKKTSRDTRSVQEP